MKRLLLPLSFFLAACLGPIPRVTAPPSEPAPPAAPAQVLSPDGAALVEVPEDALPDFADDGGLQDLEEAAVQSLDYFRSLPAGTAFTVGPERLTAGAMAEGMKALLGLMDLPPDEFRDEVRRRFKTYRSAGTDGRGTVTFSAYYEHTLDAALSPGGEFQFPLYAKPSDMVESDAPRGRTVSRREKGLLVPYFTREEIDSGGALEGKDLEIAWAADPLEVFFLQVQGSGWLRVPGEARPRRVRFAAHNGHPYKSVGSAMIQKGVLPKEGFGRKRMVRYFQDHPEERQTWLNVNPRYVFFKLDDGPDAIYAMGSLGRPLTPRRSVAADKALFPPGALAWMETEGPVARRFILVQDEGGAIKGPGRIDYFMGAGKGAEEDAIAFWTTGKFYVLVPR